MKINQKMMLLSAVTVVTIGIVAIVTGHSLGNLRDAFDRYNAQTTTVNALVEIKATALSVAKDDPILPETEAALQAADTHIREVQAQIERAALNPAAHKTLARIMTNWQEYLRQFNSAIKIASTSPQDALQIPDSIYQLQLLPMISDLDHLVKESRRQEDTSTATIERAMNSILWTTLLPLAIGAIVVMIGQFMLGRSLHRRVANLLHVVRNFESGDLRHRLVLEGNDEITDIAQAVNGFVGQTQSMLAQVREDATKVAIASEQLFAASERIAVSSHGQSEAAASVAATVEEMTVSIGQVAEHANNAHAISIESGNSSANSSDVVLAVTNEMHRISQIVRDSSELITALNQRSADISEIIQVIKDVAEQTNLLALNAAIEAARAGELGRGFAVVADEVRNLAARTSRSTQEIGSVIAHIQEATRTAANSMATGVSHVGTGVELTSQAGAAIAEVRTNSDHVVQVVDSITYALQEQSAASKDIARMIESIASGSQRNSEAAQQAVTTARDLDLLSRNLEKSVAQFSL